MTPRCGPGVVWKPLSDQDTSEAAIWSRRVQHGRVEAGRCATWKRRTVFRQPAPAHVFHIAECILRVSRSLTTPSSSSPAWLTTKHAPEPSTRALAAVCHETVRGTTRASTKREM